MFKGRKKVTLWLLLILVVVVVLSVYASFQGDLLKAGIYTDGTNITIPGNLTVSGTSTNSGAVTLSGTVAITGATTLTPSSGTTTLPSLNVTGTSTFRGRVDFGSAATPNDVYFGYRPVLDSLVDVGLDSNIGLVKAGTPVNAVNASRTVTFSGGNPSTSDTVTVNGRVYQFNSNLTDLGPYVVKIGADAAATAANFDYAILADGTPGTHYSTGTIAHTTCSSSITSGTVTISALTAGTVGNAYTLTESATNVTVSGTPLTGGVNATLSYSGGMQYDGSYWYLCIGDGTATSHKLWRRFSVGSAY